MEHALFGPLKFDPGQRAWTGWMTLPKFAECDGSAIAEFDQAALRRLYDDEPEWWSRRGRPPPPPSPAQEQAYRFLVEHEGEVLNKLLEATHALYRAERETWRDAPAGGDAVELDLLYPRLASPAGLRRLLRLRSVTLSGREHNGRTVVCYRFLCSWDAEHGYEMFSVGEEVLLEEPA
jgi:hypothetical protein